MEMGFEETSNAGSITTMAAFVVLGGCLLVYTYRKSPRHLRMHWITALFWMLLLGVATLSLITEPTNSVIAHLLVLISGALFLPSWRQLQERRHEVGIRSTTVSLYQRWATQTLWGPIALLCATAMISCCGQTCLNKAVNQHDMPTVFLLQEYRLGDIESVSIASDDAAGLGQMVREQDTDMVATYLTLGGYSRYDKEEALAFAVQQDNPVITEMLLHDGAALDGTMHETPLYLAAKAGQWKQVRTLLHHGANRKKIGIDGETPFQVAKHQGCFRIVELLLQPNP